LQRVVEGRVVEQAEEEHVVRFFFADELATLLDRAGFSLVALSAFPDAESPPDESTWNALGVARAAVPSSA
jgi:hypothetical protein